MPILVDYSQIAIAGILQFQEDLKKGSDEKIVNLIRHVVLNSLQYNKRTFGKKYGDMVICCDGRDYWRKEIFPYYKANRAKNRKDSDLNWALIFDTLSSIRDDLAEHFPYKVIHRPRAEADDVIGVLTEYLQTNDMISVGLDEDPQPVLILSSDQDNFQLHRFKNVKQYSPGSKKYVSPEDARQALIEKVCTGDAGDGIPNIMSGDNFLAEGIRQKSFMRNRLPEFYEKGIDACKSDEERERFLRNQRLIDYSWIPTDLRADIINTYQTTEVKGNRQKIMSYLVHHKCRNLLDNIEDF